MDKKWRAYKKLADNPGMLISYMSILYGGKFITGEISLMAQYLGLSRSNIDKYVVDCLIFLSKNNNAIVAEGALESLYSQYTYSEETIHGKRALGRILDIKYSHSISSVVKVSEDIVNEIITDLI